MKGKLQPPIPSPTDLANSSAGVGAPQINLWRIGKLAGMDLYVDVARQPDPDTAYKKAVGIMFHALVVKPSIERKEDAK